MNFTNKNVSGTEGTARYQNTFQMYELHQFKTDIDKHFMSIKMCQGQRALLDIKIHFKCMNFTNLKPI